MKLFNNIIYLLIKTYTKIYVQFLRKEGVVPRGLGVLQRLTTEDRILRVAGYSFYVSAEVADSYGMLTGGYFSEPETHAFLDHILQQLDGVTFVDGGCNVGEFVIAVGCGSSADRVVGYDIHPGCIEACRQSIQLNGLEDRCTVHFRGLGADAGSAHVNFGQHAPQGTNLFDEDGRETRTVEISTLDREMEKGILAGEAPYVVLLDVEGYECEILKGASAFVKRHWPLIVFEYNVVSRQFFTLNEIQQVLGDEYTIYRLAPDGYLDRQLDETWNCVAIPAKGRSDLRQAAIQRIRDCNNSLQSDARSV
jgi:FkbM family methyltransferase